MAKKTKEVTPTLLTPVKTKVNLFEIIAILFCGLLITSNIVAQKFFDFNLFGKIPLSLDVGTLLLFPILYIIGDIIPEVYGYAASRKLIWYGFAINVFVALIFQLAILLPHSQYFDYQPAFAKVLGSVTGLVAASMAGYWCGSFANSFIMVRMKQWMIKWDPTSKWIPLRTIASTIVGEFFDTAIFVGLATLFGVFPLALYISLVLTQWLLKTIIETAFTPLTVFVIKKVKKYEGIDMVGTSSFNPFAIKSQGGQNIANK